MGGRYAFALARHAPDRVACFVIGASSASTASAYPAEPGMEGPPMTGLRGGPNEVIKLYGEEWMTPPLRERLLARRGPVRECPMECPDRADSRRSDHTGCCDCGLGS